VLLLLEIGIVSGLLVLKSGGSVLLLKESLLAFLKGFGKLRESGTVGHYRGMKKKKKWERWVWKQWAKMMALIQNVVGFLSKRWLTSKNARKSR
jgi:hypothetical protein